MNQSTNYKFNLPSDDDFYDINQQNENWNKADENLKNLEDKKVDATGGDLAEQYFLILKHQQRVFQYPRPKKKQKPAGAK